MHAGNHGSYRWQPAPTSPRCLSEAIEHRCQCPTDNAPSGRGSPAKKRRPGGNFGGASKLTSSRAASRTPCIRVRAGRSHHANAHIRPARTTRTHSETATGPRAGRARCARNCEMQCDRCRRTRSLAIRTRSWYSVAWMHAGKRPPRRRYRPFNSVRGSSRITPRLRAKKSHHPHADGCSRHCSEQELRQRVRRRRCNEVLVLRPISGHRHHRKQEHPRSQSATSRDPHPQ